MGGVVFQDWRNLSADSLEYTTFLLKPLDFEQDDAGDGEDGGLDQGGQQRTGVRTDKQCRLQENVIGSFCALYLVDHARRE